MHIVISVIAFIIVGIGVLANRTDVFYNHFPPDSVNGGEVLSETVDSLNEESESADGDVEIETVEEPTSSPTSQPTTPPTVQGNQTDNNSQISYYQYPNSKVVSSSSTTMTLSSSDNTDTITDWYKDRITEKGMGVRSFVKTKANDKVLNKLSGASNSDKVDIEISRPSGDTITTIMVSLTSV
jgi:hypothetical protein